MAKTAGCTRMGPSPHVMSLLGADAQTTEGLHSWHKFLACRKSKEQVNTTSLTDIAASSRLTGAASVKEPLQSRLVSGRSGGEIIASQRPYTPQRDASVRQEDVTDLFAGLGEDPGRWQGDFEKDLAGLSQQQGQHCPHCQQNAPAQLEWCNYARGRFLQNLRTFWRLSQHHLTQCSRAAEGAPEVPGCNLTAAGGWSRAIQSRATLACGAESC